MLHDFSWNERNIHQTLLTRKNVRPKGTTKQRDPKRTEFGQLLAPSRPVILFNRCLDRVVVQIDDAWLDLIVADFEYADGARQAETLGPGAARIEEQRPAPLSRVALMAMAEDDGIGHALFDDTLVRRAHLLDGRELVADKKSAIADNGQTLVRKTHGRRIIIAAHGDDGRDRFQSPDQIFVADVARMNDAVNACEEIENPFVQFAVRV